jgi:hypothetical protein
MSSRKLPLLTGLIIFLALTILPLLSTTASAQLPTKGSPAKFGKACNTDATFLGLPAWYKYLKNYVRNDPGGACAFDLGKGNQSGDCTAAHTAGGTCVEDAGVFVLIGLAIVDILLRLAGMVAVGFIIYGGIKYVLSQGEPDHIKQAQSTIINALIGLVIAIIATGVVAFAGSKLGG